MREIPRDLRTRDADSPISQELADCSPAHLCEIPDCSDGQFWDAFPPDDAEVLPDEGDFWLEPD